jgi:hypothetical protein
MANPQNKSEEIAAKEQELEELKARADAPIAEYPKMIPDPNNPELRIIVGSKEEHDAKRGTVVKAFDLTPEEQEAKNVARAEADKEAAGAKSRLAGPENEQRPVKGKASAYPDAPRGIVGRAVAKVKGKK